MKTTFFATWASYLLLIVTLSSCSDHRLAGIPPGLSNARLRVKAIRQELPYNLAKISSFSYDTLGRLRSVFTYQSPDSTMSALEYNTYTYDSQNHLTQLLHALVSYPRPSPGTEYRHELYTYQYNALGQVSNLTYRDGSGPPFLLSFTYNNADQLIGSTRLIPQQGLMIMGKDTLAYTGHDLTSWNWSQTFDNRAGGLSTIRGVVHYTHDDKLNPFYGTYVIPAPYPKGFIFYGSISPLVRVETYFGGVDNVLTLSQHNVLSSIESFIGNTKTTTYQYQYNAAGLPTVRTTIVNQNPVETIHVDYEAY